jgi:chemotaxis protein MotB
MVRMRRRRNDEDEENLERWLLTYADLITLLLAFFIIMYSMSKVDSERFSSIMDALNGVLRGGEVGLAAEGAIITYANNTGNAEQQKAELYEEVQQMLDDHGLGGSVEARMDAHGVVMTLGEQVLFDQGRADLKPSAMQVLDEIVEILAELTHSIRIEGHTDNVPINNERFASNWELSVARSTSVIRYLLEEHGLPPEKLSAAGCGEYRPIEPNDTPEQRAMNRRVDIVLLPDTETMQEEEPGGEYSGR